MVCYSTFMPANFNTLAHFSVSAEMDMPNSEGFELFGF
jgi:hypothetical protein